MDGCRVAGSEMSRAKDGSTAYHRATVLWLAVLCGERSRLCQNLGSFRDLLTGYYYRKVAVYGGRDRVRSKFESAL